MVSTTKRGSEASLLADQGAKAVSVFYYFHEVQSTDLPVLIIGVLCCVATAVSSAIFYFLFGLMLDSLNGETQLFDVNYLLYILVAVAFGTGILGWCDAISWTVLSENQALRFREKCVKHLLSHDARWYVQNNLSSDKLALGVDVSSAAVNDGIKAYGSFIGLLVKCLSCLCVCFYGSWGLSIIVILTFVAVRKIWSTAVDIVCWGREEDNFQDNYESFELNSTVFSSIEKIRTILILNLQEETIKKFLSQLKQSNLICVNKGLRSGFKSGFNVCVSLFVYGICFFYCATVIANQLADRCASNCTTGGTLCAVFFSFIIAANALYSMPGPLSDIYKARLAVATAAASERSSDVFMNPLSDSTVGAKSSVRKPNLALRENQSQKQKEREKERDTAERELRMEDLYSSRPEGDLWDLLATPVPVLPSRARTISASDNQDDRMSEYRGAYTVSPLSAGSARDRSRGKGVAMGNQIDNEMWTGDDRNSFRSDTAVRNIKMMENTKSSVNESAVFKTLADEPEVTPRSSWQGTAVGIGGAGMEMGMGMGMGANGLTSSDGMNYPAPCDTPCDSRSRANSDTPLFELVNPDDFPAPYLSSALSPTSALSPSRSYPAMEASSARTVDSRRSVKSHSLTQSLSPRPYEHRSPRPSHGMQLVNTQDPHDLPVEEEDIMDLDHGLKFRLQRLLAANLLNLSLGLLGAAMIGLVPTLWAKLLAESENILFFSNAANVTPKASSLVCYFVALGLACCVGYLAENYFINKMGQKIALELRSQMFQRLLTRKISYFETPETSPLSLTSLVLCDPVTLNSSMGESISSYVQASVTALSSLALAFSASWEVSVLFLAALPLNIALTVWVKRTAAKSRSTPTPNKTPQGNGVMGGSEGKGSVRDANALLSTALSSLETVASFSLTDEVCAHYLDLYTEEQAPALRSRATYGFVRGWCLAMMPLTYALLFWLFSNLMLSGRVTFLSFLIALNSLMLGSLGVGTALQGAGSLSDGFSAAARMFRCIEGESESEHCIDDEHETHTQTLRGADGGPPCGPLEGDIEFRNIIFKYPTSTSSLQGSAPFTLCIDSLFVPMGQYLAIVGPEGSGKTTLMSLLLRLHDPTDGVIYFEGQDSRNLDPCWLRSNIGYVERETHFFEGTIAANINKGKSGDRNLVLSPRPSISPRPAITPRTTVKAPPTTAKSPLTFSKILRIGGNGTPTQAVAPHADTEAPFSDLEEMELTSIAPPVTLADCSHVSPDVIQASSAAGAHEFITHLQLGYDTAIEGADAEDRLTAAQRQLIGLSRSLMRNPPLLLLDDVTAGLEEEEELSVLASLSAVKLMRSSGDTTIVASSKLSAIVHADSIVVVVGGKIVQRGTHQHLLGQPGWYADQWQVERALRPQDE